MKKIMVLAGMASMLLCGCGRAEVKTEQDVVTQEAIENNEYVVNELSTKIADAYVDAIYEHFGEDLIESQITCDEWGVYYMDIYSISWEALEDIAEEKFYEE